MTMQTDSKIPPEQTLNKSVFDAVDTFLCSSGLGVSEVAQSKIVEPLLLAAWAVLKLNHGMTPERFGTFIGAAGEILAEQELAPKELDS
jgi:hypothetical protein